MIPAFAIGRLPKIEFGSGRIDLLPDIIARHGSRLLIVTGGASFTASESWGKLKVALNHRKIGYDIIRIPGEPTPDEIDHWVQTCRVLVFDVVLGIGGGSVLDAAKAIAGLLRPGNSVMDHLEGAGPEMPYCGPAVPFIAVPTTAGTGSEATKNAVLTRHGPDGFKKSFRDDALMADHAVIDPDLLATCSPERVAANGMDALTQLLESFVSIRANPMTDALALAGIEAVREGLPVWYEEGQGVPQARSSMALAALLSGICLAQTGLGSVHGLAQPLGSLFPMPHGVVCGALVAEATQVNIEALQDRTVNHPALDKYAAAGRILMRDPHARGDVARLGLINLLRDWTKSMGLPCLSQFGVTEDDVPRIVRNSRGSSMKTNPVVLTDQEIGKILQRRLV